MSDHKCFHCNGAEDVEMRCFDWDYRPRAKDRARGEMDRQEVLQVELCAVCYSQVVGVRVCGWDWWDAYDGLDGEFEVPGRI